MTVLEAEQVEPRIELPAGIEINSEVVSDLGTITLLAGNVLIVKIDPEIINTYQKHSAEGVALSGLLFNLREKLSKEHQLIFSTVPGEPSKIGIWVGLDDGDN